MEALVEPASTFATRACEELRSRSLETAGARVWLHPNAFRAGAAPCHPSRAEGLPVATNDTRWVLVTVRQLSDAMYRPGYGYQKAGVGLLDLRAAATRQGDMFHAADPRTARPMEALDRANTLFGRGGGGLCIVGGQQRPLWACADPSLARGHEPPGPTAPVAVTPTVLGEALHGFGAKPDANRGSPTEGVFRARKASQPSRARAVGRSTVLPLSRVWAGLLPERPASLRPINPPYRGYRSKMPASHVLLWHVGGRAAHAPCPLVSPWRPGPPPHP